MTQRYPLKPPELLLESPLRLSPAQVKELDAVMNRKAKELVGQEMLFDVSPC
jgi:hypothetical protein